MPVEGVFHNLVITKIKKEYAGQGQKVMNAMWGAGQMMFNKILVLADEAVRIQDYEQLAKYVFLNLNPATDIYFSTGPMDVLDHSCSKLGFGGKMCIDGTGKFAEEMEDDYWQVNKENTVVQNKLAELLKDRFTEIMAVNDSLLANGISCVLISVKKNRKGHIRDLHKQVCELKETETVKLILYVEHTVDPHDLPAALWRFCNNLDPKRDHTLCKRPSLIATGKNIACMGLDGTRKTKEFDEFHRDWPNIIVADNATIQAIDEKWEKLGAGEFIPSPSLKFKKHMYGEEATARE
jgi:4-hydroxy-3-polyprenylbenzoate decarboxylase